jgi:predicted nucleic acid-binding Zn ribbon protein
MRRKYSQTRLQPISDILFTLFKRRGLAAALEEKTLLKLWDKVVGPQIASQSIADSLKGKTLFVKTISSVWVQQLHFMKDDIRHKFNELAGKTAVKDIISVGHQLSHSRAADHAAARRKIILRDRDKKMIEDCTTPLADRELAAILKRVMQKEIIRRRLREDGQDQ